MGIIKVMAFIFAAPALIVAYGAGAIVERSRHPIYALQPEDCPHGATGWELHETYKGGIEKGGMTSNIKYECKNEQ